MTLVYQHRHDRFGDPVTYAYEELGYWDKELKKFISKRKLVGKVDDNGRIVPTGKGGRPRIETPASSDSTSSNASPVKAESPEYKELYLQMLQQLSESDNKNIQLTNRLASLEKKLSRYQKLFSNIRNNVLAFEE